MGNNYVIVHLENGQKIPVLIESTFKNYVRMINTSRKALIGQQYIPIENIRRLERTDRQPRY
jgi:hypothetical protein